jgi:hypothetical protein
MQSDNLGGRLPLLDPAKLSETQREVYDLANSTMASLGRGRSLPEQDRGWQADRTIQPGPICA